MRLEYSSFFGIKQTSTCSLNLSFRIALPPDTPEVADVEFSSMSDENEALKDGESSGMLDSKFWSEDCFRPNRAASAHKPVVGFSSVASSSIALLRGSILLALPSSVSSARGGCGAFAIWPSKPSLKINLLRRRWDSSLPDTVVSAVRGSLIVVLLHSWSVMLDTLFIAVVQMRPLVDERPR